MTVLEYSPVNVAGDPVVLDAHVAGRYVGSISEMHSPAFGFPGTGWLVAPCGVPARHVATMPEAMVMLRRLVGGS